MENDLSEHIGRRKGNYCNCQVYYIIHLKQNELKHLTEQRAEFLRHLNENQKFVFEKNELETKLLSKTFNINALRNVRDEAKNRIVQNEEEIAVLKNRIAKINQKLDVYTDKFDLNKKILRASENAAQTKKVKENEIKLKVFEYEKQRVDELNRYIFNIFKFIEDDNLQKSTRTALKDARQTVYVNGRWILANDHVHYQIIESMLPSDGDYLIHFKDLQDKDDKLKDEVHQLEKIERYYDRASSSSSSSPASPNGYSISQHDKYKMSSTLVSNSLFNPYSILSGLTFTIQFVNLIAFYLNIVLPYNLPHNLYLSKFCSQQAIFQNIIAKLNTNIVFLSIQQYIPVTNLLPKHTLENLYHFLTRFKELRIRLREKNSVVFPNHMIPLLEEMFVNCEGDNYYQECLPSFVINDNEDWETVPHSDEIPSDDTCSNASASQTTASHVLAKSSNIFSSVSNFWRTFNYGAASSPAHLPTAPQSPSSASSSSSTVTNSNASNYSNFNSSTR